MSSLDSYTPVLQSSLNLVERLIGALRRRFAAPPAPAGEGAVPAPSRTRWGVWIGVSLGVGLLALWGGYRAYGYVRQRFFPPAPPASSVPALPGPVGGDAAAPANPGPAGTSVAPAHPVPASAQVSA